MDKFGNVLLCDAVYVDRTSNKAVLAGVFSGDILVKELPVTFSAAIYAEYWPKRAGDISVDLMIFVNDIKIGGAKLEMSDVRIDGAAMLVVPSYQFVFEKTGTLEIHASVDGSAPVSILSKKLEFVESSVFVA